MKAVGDEKDEEQVIGIPGRGQLCEVQRRTEFSEMSLEFGEVIHIFSELG